MASGPIVEDDGVRETQRNSEIKVYTRKAFKGRKNKTNGLNVTTPVTGTDKNGDNNASAVPTTTTIENNNEKSTVENRSADEAKDNGCHSSSQAPDQVTVPENGTFQQQVNSRLGVVSDDSYSLNRRQDEPLSFNLEQDDGPGTQDQPLANGTQDQPLANGTLNPVVENLVKISLSSQLKQDKREQRKKLESQLSLVRSLVNRIEERQALIGGNGNSNLLVDNGIGNDGGVKRAYSEVASGGVKRAYSEVASGGVKRAYSEVASGGVKRAYSEVASGGVMRAYSEVASGGVMRAHSEVASGGVKRAHSEVAFAGVPRDPTRLLNQLSVSVLENSQGVSEIIEKEKRTPKANQFYHNSEFLLAKDKFPPEKKSKSNVKKHGGGEMGHGIGVASKYFKSCSSLLEKLMKHKYAWVFNTPVDVEGLGLHDYFTIITHPMDLGTVKSRLNKNWYKSPKEFAEDVRLTFDNAMTYNPEGQDVHVMADQLSKLFEERWAIIELNYNHEMRYGIEYGSATHIRSPFSQKAPPFRPPPLDMERILDRSESMTYPPKPMSITPSARTPALKKPKAKDPYKRDMTYEEKQKLSTNLQNLPSEKLDAIVQIIKKRNSALSQHDDEIEVDIDSVDAETLWELDRFVSNYKKSLSKHKRKAELAMQARAQAEFNANQKSQAPAMVEVPQETQADERNVPPSLHVQEIRADYGSKSSSSSSSSSDSGSSSSDSDSDSSSTSGSDAGSPRT